MAPSKDAPTKTQYSNLQAAYDYFNRKLFDGALSQCLLVFGRDQKSCYGYFHAEQWANKSTKEKCHMISLTPMHLNRDLKLVFGTLVHEMCHLWQQDFGKPSKNGYHNKEWAEKMKEVGLHPSSTGEEGGRETGQKVSHYIVAGGPFEEVFKNMPEHISLPWIGAGLTEKKKAVRNKVKYSCPVCEANVWGKPDMSIICGDCDQNFEEQ